MSWLIALNVGETFTEYPTDILLNPLSYEICLYAFSLNVSPIYFYKPIYCFCPSVSTSFWKKNWESCIGCILPAGESNCNRYIRNPIYFSLVSLSGLKVELPPEVFGTLFLHLRRKS